MAVDEQAGIAKKRLGRRIVRARDRAGLTQHQLAERLVGRNGTERSTDRWHQEVSTMKRNLRRYENGHNMPRGDVLMAIADETGADPREFAAGDDDDEESDPVSELRRIAGELTARGVDDLATDLLHVVRDVVANHGKQEPTAALSGADGDRLVTKGA